MVDETTTAPVAPIRSEHVHAWAGVHRGGSAHATHVHPAVGLAGTFYASLPEGGDAQHQAGQLHFTDPRVGSHGVDVRFTPKQGDVVLFPPWLPHRVASTFGKVPRVAVSFNVDGAWEHTSETNLVFVF
jgi:uncharacterized protein (TIGR02466 family)